MKRKITVPSKSVRPAKSLRHRRRLRRPGQLPKADAKADPEQISEQMYRQDVAPFAEGFDVLAKELAHALPAWTNKLAKDSAGARAGLFLRTMRNAAGLTQVELGKQAAMRQADISDLENGDGVQGPSFDVIARIADSCGFYLTFEAKQTAKTYSTREAAVAAARGHQARIKPHRFAGGGEEIPIVRSRHESAVRTFIMDEHGAIQEFEGKSRALTKDESVILEDPAGHFLKVSIESARAKIAVAEAEDDVAAAVQQLSAAG